jgi:transposase-like protein
MTEDATLIEKVRRLRWAAGVRCPRCSSGRVRLHAGGAAAKRTYWCLDCGRRFNDLTGLPFARSHIALEKWLVCARRLAAGDRATCAELSRDLGVRLATAWRMRRVLQRALGDPFLTRLLSEGEP